MTRCLRWMLFTLAVAMVFFVAPVLAIPGDPVSYFVQILVWAIVAGLQLYELRERAGEDETD